MFWLRSPKAGTFLIFMRQPRHVSAEMPKTQIADTHGLLKSHVDISFSASDA
jgi:hypothetical protein